VTGASGLAGEQRPLRACCAGGARPHAPQRRAAAGGRVRTRERPEPPARRPAAPLADEDTKSACWPAPAAARAHSGAPDAAAGGGASSREMRALARSQLGGDSAPGSPPVSGRQGARAPAARPSRPACGRAWLRDVRCAGVALLWITHAALPGLP